MTINYINTGSGPNRGDGDSLRVAFTKINANFEQVTSELSAIESGSTSTLVAGTATFAITTAGTLVLNGQPFNAGNVDLGNFSFNGSTLQADNPIFRANDAALTLAVDTTTWTFDNSGTLTLPSTNTITAALSQQVGTIVYGIEAWNWHNGTGDPYSWNPSINPVFDSLYNIGPSIIGWTFYSINNPMDSVTITSYGDRSLGFSDDLGNGPYVAQSPDYVPFHGNPVVIQTQGPQFQANWTFGSDGKLTTPGNIEVNGGRVTLHPYGNAYIESVDYGVYTATSALNIFAGPDQKIKLRAGLGLEAFWTFGTDGTLTFPSGAQIIADSQDGTYLQANPGDNGYAGISNLTGNSWMWTANDGGAYISSGDGYTGGTWSFNTNSNLNIPGDIQDANGSVIRVASTNTAPARHDGQLWFNNVEGRLYIKDNGIWVDANPTVIPPPSTYLDDITVEGSTFTINGSSLTIDEAGTLLVNGAQVTGGTVTTGPTNQITSGSYRVSVADTGVVTMATMRGNLEFGALPEIGGPNHFHIMRAPGQDGSSGMDLFFGDDFNYVRQRPAQYGNSPAYGVEIGTYDLSTGTSVQQVWRFGTDGRLTLPNQSKIGGEDVNSFLTFNWGDDVELKGGDNLYLSGMVATIRTNGNANQWTFGYNGILSVPNDIQDANGSVVRVATTSTAPTRADGQLWFNNQEGRLYIKDNGTWVDANPTQIPSPSTYLDDIQVDGSEFLINGYSLTVDETGTLLVDGQQVTGSGGSSGWQLTSSTVVVSLTSDGTLTLPNGGTISNKGDAIKLQPAGVSSSTQALVIYPTAQDGNHIHLTADGGETDLYLGDDDQYVKVDHGGSIVIGAVGANTSTWTFGTNGVLTLSTASTILGAGTDPNVYIETSTTATTSAWTFGTNGILTLPAATPVIKGGGTGTDVTIVASTGSNTSTWVFAADGTSYFPDKIILAPSGQDITLQSSAYTQIMWAHVTDQSIADIYNNTNSDFYVESGGATLDIGYKDGSNNQQYTSWHWNKDGSFQFPDNTVQTTAWTGTLPAPADGDSVSGSADLVFYDGTWNYTSRVTISPGTSMLTLNGNSGTGGITFPDATVQTTAFTGTVAYSNITGAPASVNKTSGSWTLAPGANTVSITVAPGGNYQMWVNGNIPNGIVTWNATVSTSNTNVPVVGVQYGWYYAAGNKLVLTSMPNQIVGTAGSISTATVATISSNVFTFGITNNSTSTQVINWGYTTL